MYVLKVLIYNTQNPVAGFNASIPIPSTNLADWLFSERLSSTLEARGIMLTAVRDALKTAIHEMDRNPNNGKTILVDVHKNDVHVYIALHNNLTSLAAPKPAYPT